MLKLPLLSQILPSSHRSRQIALYAAATYIAKFINLGASLIAIPLTYNYLGAAEFGVLTAIVSAVSFLSFADLGTGFGLQSILPGFIHTNDFARIKQYIGSTFVFQILISMLLFLAALTVVLYTSLLSLINLDILNPEVRYSFITFMFCFCLSIPFSIVQRVQTALQEGHISQIWSGVGGIASLLLLFIFVNFRLSLPWILFALYGVQMLVVVLNYLFEFYRRKVDFKPDIRAADMQIGWGIAKVGALYIVIQLASIVLSSSSNLFLAHQSGMVAVADFAVMMRFVMIIAGPLAMVFPALLPSINDALLNEEHQWIKKLLRKSMGALLIYAVAIALLLGTIGKILVNKWMGAGYIIEDSLWMPMIAYAIYFQVNGLLSFVMLSNLYIKRLLWLYTVAVAATLYLKYLSGCYWGVHGLVGAEIIGMTVLYFIPSIYFLRKNNHI